MPAVLIHPPAVTQPDEQIAGEHPDRVVAAARTTHLLVAAVMAEERHLGEHHPHRRGHDHLVPGPAHHGEYPPQCGERQPGHGDPRRVVTTATIQQPRGTHLPAQAGEITTSSHVDSTGHHSSLRTSPTLAPCDRRPRSASRFRRRKATRTAVAPPTVPRRRNSSRHVRLDTVQFAHFRYLPRRPVSRSRREQRLRRLIGSPSYLPGRRGAMTVRMSLLAAAAFFSARFCFSDLPDFLLLDWRADLSATASSSGFGWRSATPGAAPADGCRAGPSPTWG